MKDEVTPSLERVWYLARMPKRTTIKECLTVTEFENGYRNCRDATEHERWLMIKLLASGKTVAEVSEITSSTRKGVCEIARRYNSSLIPGMYFAYS
jgi:hypothetical protein